jgi:hypothetical protein
MYLTYRIAPFSPKISSTLMSPCSMGEGEAVNGLRVLGIDLERPTQVAECQRASPSLPKMRKRYRGSQDS